MSRCPPAETAELKDIFMSQFIVGLLLILFSTRVALSQEVQPANKALRPELALQIGHNYEITCVAFSPNGRLLASGSRDTTIKLWDIASGTLRRTLSGQKASIKGIAFSPDGKLLASTGDNTIRFWDVTAGVARRIIRRSEPTESTIGIAFSPDGKTIASSGEADQTVKLWDVGSGKLNRTLAADKREAYSIAFSPDGKFLAAGYYASAAILWNVTTGKIERTFSESASVKSVAFSTDGKLLAAGSSDSQGQGVIHVWNVADGKPRRTLTGHQDLMMSVAFGPDSRQIAGCSRDGVIRLWNILTGDVLHEWKGSNLAVAFSPDGQFLAGANRDKTIALWNEDDGALLHSLRGQDNAVNCVAFSPDGKTMANGSNDHTVKLWDIATGAVSRTLSGDESAVELVAFSPDGKLIASRSWDKQIRIWNLATGTLYRTLSGHDSWITSIAFSPNSKTLFSSSEDETIKVWDVATGAVNQTVQTPEPTTIALSPDGKWLACNGPDDSIKVWKVVNGAVSATGQRILKGHFASILALVFSPDSKTLASGSADRTIKLWAMETGAVRHTMRVTTGAPTSMCFSPDGALLASVGDNEVTLWNASTGAMRRILKGHENLVLGVAFSFDGKRLVSGSMDSTIKIWEPGGGRLLATLLTLPQVDEETVKARPMSLGARPLSLGAKAADAKDEWFITTPEGWFDCSANAARFIRWNIGAENVPAERYYRRLRRPDLVQQSLRGDVVSSPDLTQQDIPPLAQFVRLQYDSAEKEEQKFVTATLEVQGRRDFKEVRLLVNGRPLPPEQEQAVQVSDVPVNLTARPLSLGAKPLSLGAKDLDLSARPLSLGAKESGTTQTLSASNYTVVKHYLFHVPLPLGAREVRLRALAYDAADLGSNPTEIVLNSPDARPVTGNLYILCAGIGQYKNGGDGAANSGAQFSNLKFSDADARAIAERFQKEGVPLYQSVQFFNGGPLVNEQATLENLRRGLQWLQQKVRPGQIDTALVFLSGHGLSDAQGRYYFPTYDFDKSNWQATSLSGLELQEALGGKLRARAVFLFADTCHSGALAGARNDDLNFEVNNSGVYMLASSSATQYSYESDEWGHGAFTLALLHALSQPNLAQDGTINFNVLSYAVPDEIAKLMQAAGQNENAMAPVVPLDGRKLDAPVVQVKN
jgi:WD40 repeat protein